jgi:hypothetical protein
MGKPLRLQPLPAEVDYPEGGRQGLCDTVQESPRIADAAAVGAVASRRHHALSVEYNRYESKEKHMYIGGGVLGTILVVLLVLWLLGMV